MSTIQDLPDFALISISSIIGDAKKNRPPLIPVCEKTWLNGVKNGIYPKPVRISARRVGWKIKDIRQLVENMEVVA